MKNEINMGSSIIDLYMEGYDEGKSDNIDVVAVRSTGKKTKTHKAKASSRRKKAYYKSKGRMMQLSSVAHYEASPEDKQVVQGMLRDHQLPMGEHKCENTCGTSIGNKRRSDTANQKMREALFDSDNDETVIFTHTPSITDEPFKLYGYSHEHA